MDTSSRFSLILLAAMVLSLAPTASAAPRRSAPPAKTSGSKAKTQAATHGPAGAAKTCAECQKKRDPLQELIDKVARQEAGRPHSGFNPHCNDFVDGMGELGSTGRVIQNAIFSNSKYYSTFIESNYLTAICPKYKDMTLPEDRAKAWVLYWMALAHKESQCNANILHGTTQADGSFLNRTLGWGYFAMELSPQDRAGRGKACYGNIKAVSVQVSCSLDILDKQLTKKHALQTADSYWSNNRAIQSRIAPLMKQFRLCYDPPAPVKKNVHPAKKPTAKVARK